MHHSINGSSAFLLAAALGLSGFTRQASAAEPADAAPSNVTPVAPADAAIPPANDAPGTSAASVAPSTTSATAASATPETAASATPETAAGGDSDFYSAGGSTNESSGAPTYPKLDLSGFTDFTFAANVSSKTSPLRNIIQPYSSFSVGNLNLYLAAALAPKWRLLAEVRFLYLPQGNQPFPTATGQAYPPFDATANDYADDNRPFTWGGVQIQRVQIDYTFHQLLSFRVGQFLTPVGIWNIDHGSPTVIGVYRPYVVGQGLFPERQTGLQIYGEWSTGTHAVGYALTLSNGRGPADSYADFDNNKAVGGRLTYTNSSLGSLTLGVSGYDGTYASRNKEFALDTSRSTPAIVGVNPLTLRYHERSLGADARFQWQGLLVQAEVLQHEVVYQNDVRPIENGQLKADYLERGFYALAGYRTPWFGVMPFVMIEALNFASTPIVAPGWAASAGLNIRPEPTVVVKLQFHSTHLGSDTSSQPYHGVLNRVLAQVAVAF